MQKRPRKDIVLEKSKLKVRVTTPGPRARMARDGVIPTWRRMLIIEALREGEPADSIDMEPTQADCDRATQRYVCACTLPGKGVHQVTADYPPERGQVWFDDLPPEDWDQLCEAVMEFARENGAEEEVEASNVRPLSKAETA